MRGETVIMDSCYNTGKITSNEKVSMIGCGTAGILGTIGNWSTQSYATITNSYSIGEVSSTTPKAELVGKILGNDLGNGRRDLANLYYLDTAVGGSNLYGGVAQTKEQLKELASTLGESFTKDVSNSNQGFPLLKWQDK